LVTRSALPRFPTLAPSLLHTSPTRRSSDLFDRDHRPGPGHLCPEQIGVRPHAREVHALHLGVLGEPRGDLPRPLLLGAARLAEPDRKSTRLNSSHASRSYAVFCLKIKKKSQ